MDLPPDLSLHHALLHVRSYVATMRSELVATLLLHVPVVGASPPPQPQPLSGDVSAVWALIDRLLPRSSTNPSSTHTPSDEFDLQLLGGDEDCAPNVAPPCFSLADIENNNNGGISRIQIKGTRASELTAGLGFYLRHYCNMTIGWPRGGGSNVFVPDEWPSIGPTPLVKQRNSAYTYLMNVCTHSYSLVWYGWKEWEQFIDWMALSGINLMLAMTGQEEVQYKVFRRLGLDDIDVRSWFNGPALLTWSRGQNEYGAGLLGPLPRSWMKDQWDLQRKILPRLRSLGITGQLPGFQGNVPIKLKALYNDTNITRAGATGWMDSLDPLFGKIADLWMETLIADFGTDHWYQLDGYFDGGVAPWMSTNNAHAKQERKLGHIDKIRRDEMAYRRATSAYQGLNRTDPNAIWSYQGWQIIGWESEAEAATFKGFAESAPQGRFVVIDMSTHGEGQWKQFNNSAFFGVQFVWTTLHDFGGTDGLKGNLGQINRIPFDAPPSAHVIGVGATPEGIDQNPIYYEFIFDQSFRDEPVADIASMVVNRGHRRYGLSSENIDVAKAWKLLAESAYSIDLGVQDGSGLTHLPGWTDGYWSKSSWFQDDRFTPKPVLCKIYHAWGDLIHAAELAMSSAFQTEPFTYDLVNTGREILANIATPASLNFSDAFSRPTLDRDELASTGSFYIDILNDADTLVGTDRAFLLGPWIDMARRLDSGTNDCITPMLVDNHSGDCRRFLEWNARAQLTTWGPVSKTDTSIPQGPIDYASKHWQGLIKDYYAKRARVTLEQALQDEEAGRPLNSTMISRLRAELAYNFTTATNKYPTTPTGDPVAMSRVMFDKYSSWFASCDPDVADVVSILRYFKFL